MRSEPGAFTQWFLPVEGVYPIGKIGIVDIYLVNHIQVDLESFDVKMRLSDPRQPLLLSTYRLDRRNIYIRKHNPF